MVRVRVRVRVEPGPPSQSPPVTPLLTTQPNLTLPNPHLPVPSRDAAVDHAA